MEDYEQTNVEIDGDEELNEESAKWDFDGTKSK
jgi:hypothetical protein